MDPQHRLLLELAYEALENAGCDPDRYRGRIGVFTGSALNTYFTNVGLNSRLAEQYIPTLIGNDKDFLSTRISYKLNLKGPSITIQTACSTSMVAVHLARQSLLSEETDLALAGAISVRGNPGGGVTRGRQALPVRYDQLTECTDTSGGDMRNDSPYGHLRDKPTKRVELCGTLSPVQKPIHVSVLHES